MPNFRSGELVIISGPICILRKNGKMESFRGKVVRVISSDVKHCRCDLGLDRLVYIPKTHLSKAA